jgi:hypothetical protein
MVPAAAKDSNPGESGTTATRSHPQRTVAKVLPARRTARGRRSLEKATVAVRSVEVRMLAGMIEAEQSDAFQLLQSMIHSLHDGNVSA